MFLGEYIHTTDAKGRVIIPAKFRAGLGERFFITKGFDKCLFVFPEREWRTIYDKVKELPMMDEDVIRFSRFFFGGAMEGDPDAQFRVMLAANLRSHAQIKKEVVSVGVSSRIEIWSKENWDAYSGASNEFDAALAEKMALLGI
ncbi:MAG: division/cell wall cluster transcriptional repressor MraZ [Clostridiales bacterium]|nr:division/cell wall cluster transcriptional repressor MraZ [Clostridiales bacterium]